MSPADTFSYMIVLIRATLALGHWCRPKMECKDRTTRNVEGCRLRRFSLSSQSMGVYTVV